MRAREFITENTASKNFQGVAEGSETNLNPDNIAALLRSQSSYGDGQDGDILMHATTHLVRNLKYDRQKAVNLIYKTPLGDQIVQAYHELRRQGVAESYSNTTFKIKRRKLNVPALIKSGAIFVTYPHGEQGWETDNKEDWAYSLISLYNVLQGGWPSEAKKYLKPESYKKAEQQINSSAPNLGSDQLVYDGKYNQILWSIKKLGIPDNVAFLDKSQQGVAEGFPQPSESSGKAKQFNPNAKIQTKEMTLDQILNTVKGIPYVNEVIQDWDAKDYSWGVTKKVIEYAQYLQKNPQSVANLPPLVVIDGQLNDGAHRLSAINLLQKRMDAKNPLWKQVKLKVNFGTSADVASEQGVAEESEETLTERRRKKKRRTMKKRGIYGPVPYYGVYFGTGEGDGGGEA